MSNVVVFRVFSLTAGVTGCAMIFPGTREISLVPVTKFRVRRVRDVDLGHLVALPHQDETVLGIVVEAPPEFKSDRLVLGLSVDLSEPTRVPYLFPSSGAEQCFDFGGPATFLWTPEISRIQPRWHAGLQVGHLAVTENVVAINGCFGRQQIKYGYWDVLSGRMVWDKYTMFLTEWQLRAPGDELQGKSLLDFPADFRLPRPVVTAEPEQTIQQDFPRAITAS